MNFNPRTKTKLSKSFSRIGAVMLFVLCLLNYTSIAQTTWTGAVDTDWATAGNWSAGIPDAADDVTIAASSNNPIMSGTTSSTIKSLSIQGGSIINLTLEAGADLTIDGATDDGIKIEVNGGALFNSGTIKIDNTGGDAIEIRGPFTNRNTGVLLIGQNGGNIGGIGVYTVGSTGVTNQGTMTIDNTASDGVLVTQGAVFNNSGTINIGQNAGAGSIGSNGLNIGNNSKLINTNICRIDNTTDDGINLAGEIDNRGNGKLFIGQSDGNISKIGVHYNTGIFRNAGQILIDNTGQEGFSQEGSTFNNNSGALVQIGASGSIGGDGLFVDGQSIFNNNSCATVEVFGNLNSPSASDDPIRNFGHLIVNTVQSHTIGYSLRNNGILENVQLPLVPNVNNNGIIVAPVSGAGTLADVLQIGASNSHTVATQWYDDEAGIMLAGTYSPVDNSFTSNNSSCTPAVFPTYFEITSNSCTYDVSIALTLGNAGTPSISCPIALYASVDSNCEYVLEDYTGDVTVSDDCDANLTITQSPAPGLFVLEGTILTLTQTVTNSAGNSASCQIWLDVADRTPPTIVCPPTQALAADENCLGTMIDFSSLATVSDNCDPDPEFTLQSPSIGTTVADGTTVYLLVTDEGGGSNFCSFTVSVESTPSISCPNSRYTYLDSNCELSLEDYTGDGTVSDNCDANLTITQSPAPGTIISGETELTLTQTVTNSSGNSASCQFTLNVWDNMPPTMDCPSTHTIIANEDCTATLGDLSNIVTLTDNCDPNPEIFLQYPPIGTEVTDGTRLELYVTDEYYNTTACAITLNVIDTQPPTMNCPSQVTISMNEHCQGVVPDFRLEEYVTDNCSAFENLSIGQGPNPGSLISASTTVGLSVNDEGFGTNICQFTLNLVDDTAPIAACAQIGGTEVIDQRNVYPEDDNGWSMSAGRYVGQSLVVGKTGSLTKVKTQFSTLYTPSSVTLYVVDGNDPTPPQTILATETVSVSSFNTEISLTTPVSVVEGQAITILFSTNDSGRMRYRSGDVYPSGSFWYSNDNGVSFTSLSNLDIDFTTYVTVGTTEIALGENGMATLNASDIDLGSFDYCSPVNLSIPATTFGCDDIGQQSTVLTVTDNSGNSNTCTATYLIVDNAAPTATCQDANIVMTEEGAFLGINQIVVESDDNCEVNLNIIAGEEYYTCDDFGIPHSVTVSISDDSGNSITCTQNITITDPNQVCCQYPVITSTNVSSNNICPGASRTITVTGSLNNATEWVLYTGACEDTEVTSSSTNTLIVNPSETTTYHLRGEGGCVEGEDCITITVNVEDTTPPTIVCPDTRTRILDLDCQARLFNYTDDAEVSDNCDGELDITQFPERNTMITENTIVTLTATDDAGLTSTCTFLVEIVDDVTPYAMCQTGATRDVVFEVDFECCSVIMGEQFAEAQSLTVGTTGPLSKVTTQIEPNVQEFGHPMTLTIIDGDDPNPPQTILATKTITVTSLIASFNLDVPVDVTAGQKITLIFQSPFNYGLAVNYNQSYDGGASWWSFDYGATYNGPGGTDINFVTYVGDPTIVYNLDANGVVNLSVADIDDGTYDNCEFEMSISPGNFTCNGLGTQTVTLTATDLWNNTGICTTTIEIEDHIAPTAACLNPTVYLQPDGTYTLQESEVLDFANSYDNCNFFVSEISPAVVDCDDLDLTIPVYVTISDDFGNTSTCMALVNVQKGNALSDDWSNSNIGTATGSAAYDPCEETFCLESNGVSTNKKDRIYMAYQQLCGNMEITTRVASVNNGGFGGIMIRETLDDNSKKVAMKTQLGNFIQRQIRSWTGGPNSQNQQLFRPGHDWLRITRNGNQFIGYTSSNGTNWQFAFVTNVSMNSCIYVGLVAEGINQNSTTTACFDNVSITGGDALPIVEGNNVLETEMVRAPDFSVFPNPASSETNVDLSQFENETFTMTVFNNLGQIVYRKEYDYLEEYVERLDLTDYKDGIYLINIELEDGTLLSKKLVVHNK